MTILLSLIKLEWCWYCQLKPNKVHNGITTLLKSKSKFNNCILLDKYLIDSIWINKSVKLILLYWLIGNIQKIDLVNKFAA